jgi:hypothetical protein
MDTNKKHRKGATYVDPTTDKVITRRDHKWKPPQTGTSSSRSSSYSNNKPSSQIKDLAVEQKFNTVPIRAASGYEVHQVEREGAIIGYASRPESDSKWTMTLPDGTELSNPAESLDEAGQALVVADDQVVYNKYPDYMEENSSSS